MKRLLLLLCTTTATILAFSQNRNSAIWHLTVVDSASSIGLDRATVSIGEKSYFLTDNNGNLNININDIIKTNSIIISFVGYKTLIYKAIGSFPDTLRIARVINILKEVKINGSSKKLVLGDANRLFDGGYLCGPNQEIAEFIPNNKKNKGFVISVDFAIDNGKKGIEQPFKVNLYAKEKDSMYPGEELIKDSVIIFNPKKLPIVSVNIAKYSIRLPEDGLFVGFETLSPAWYGNNLIRLKGGERYQRVPGIKGHFRDHDFKFDETEIKRKGAKYSLMREIKPTGIWYIFVEGTDFAIGATVNPE